MNKKLISTVLVGSVMIGLTGCTKATDSMTLGIGDEVKFTDAEGHEFDCEVVNIETLRPEQTEELTVKKSKNDWDISLFTCNYSGSERVTVRCAIR